MSASSSEARAVGGMFLLQLFQKLLSVLLNQLVLRHLSASSSSQSTASPESFGVAAVQLELLLSSLLFLSREGIRLALLRTVVQEEKHLQQVVNLSSLPALLVLLFSGVVHLFCPSFVGKIRYLLKSSVWFSLDSPV